MTEIRAEARGRGEAEGEAGAEGHAWRDTLRRLAGHPLSLALATAGLYLAGAAYHRAYFGALSVPELARSLGTADLLLQGFFVVFVVVVGALGAAILLVLLSAPLRRRKATEGRDAPRSGEHVLLGVFALSLAVVAVEVAWQGSLVSLPISPENRTGAALFLGLFAVMMGVLATRPGPPLRHVPGEHALLAIGLIAGLVSAGTLAGGDAARNLASDPGATVVTLHYEDATLFGADASRPAVLVAHAGGFFYVLEPQPDAEPLLRTVPEDEVRYVERHPRGTVAQPSRD